MTNPPQPTPRKPRWPWIAVGTLAALLALGGALAFTLGSNREPATAKQPSTWEQQQADTKNSRAFLAVQRNCDSGLAGTAIEDGGKTLVIDGAGEEDAGRGVPAEAMECIFAELKMPASVSEQVWATRALDGRQREAWTGYAASWSYHPDTGIQMVVKAE